MKNGRDIFHGGNIRGFLLDDGCEYDGLIAVMIDNFAVGVLEHLADGVLRRHVDVKRICIGVQIALKPEADFAGIIWNLA